MYLDQFDHFLSPILPTHPNLYFFLSLKRTRTKEKTNEQSNKTKDCTLHPALPCPLPLIFPQTIPKDPIFADREWLQASHP